MHFKRNTHSEENIPLNSTSDGFHDEREHQTRKGKERAVDDESGTPIFDVGEDEEEYDHDERK